MLEHIDTLLLGCATGSHLHTWYYGTKHDFSNITWQGYAQTTGWVVLAIVHHIVFG